MTDQSEVRGLSKVARLQIYDHCFADRTREVGGVLVGRSTSSGPIVVGSIRAESANEQLAALTFTQESWAHIHRVRDREYADFAIVGWYHSHPGHGVFLSEQDEFIHRNFFSAPSQIAYVIDPVAGREGVFGWRDGELVRWSQQRTARRPSTAQARRPGRRQEPRSRLGVDAYVYLVIIGLSLGVSFWALVLR